MIVYLSVLTEIITCPIQQKQCMKALHEMHERILVVRFKKFDGQSSEGVSNGKDFHRRWKEDSIRIKCLSLF